MIMKSTLGEHLREKRQARGLGLREMARRIEYTPSYLSKVERDKEKPSEELLVLLARHLGESSDELLLLAGRVPSDIARLLMKNPEWIVELRRHQEMPQG